MNTCLFCKLKGSSENRHWENEHFFMIFDDNPVTPGHALIIPKRHVVDLGGLTHGEWAGLQIATQEGITYIESFDLIEHYTSVIHNPNKSSTNHRYCKQALHLLETTPHPTSFNHGVNDGKEAGRTIDHLHRHIIPRYPGDMKDPRGGVRYVIPEMGNYKIERK